MEPVISICFVDGVLFRQVDQCNLHFQLCEVQQAAIREEAGRLIGQIQLCQQLLQQPVSPQEVLQDKPLDELRQLTEQLRQKLTG